MNTASQTGTLTEIAYVLDRSGSMQSLQEAAVAAFNEFLTQQREVPDPARLSLVLFDDQYDVPVSARPLTEVPELTAATYIPRGSTALLDAIGRTIHDLDARIAGLPAEERPAKVIVAIFTDGYENASRRFTSAHINDLIAARRDDKGWDFIFLAANQDAIATAAALNIRQDLGGNVDFSADGLSASSSALARKVRSMRMRASGRVDATSLLDEATPIEALIREEIARKQKPSDSDPKQPRP